MVHACDWNEHLEGLKRGLIANEVADCCVIHYGDNVQVSAQNRQELMPRLCGIYSFHESVWDNFVMFDITRFTLFMQPNFCP